ncbi:stigma-specific STIG1-like protein 1 [Beta vulgaris subsp. vulgaris]|uniref:stigma-specific STIG1-like protein 1 n=1 Tax=Beta vulgaris subsp. vulgaris TaxID=3555 RepID=UPI00254951BF|nr:stigma-specific STIG1-like protein 1 [Beta vulgaris subsp. vulgaris]
MKNFNVLIVLTLLLALFITLSYAQPKNNDKKAAKKGQDLETVDSYQGSSRFLNSKKHHYYMNPYKSRGGYNARAHLTCDRFPRVCRVKGSPGPDCCWKKCVNVKSDKLNCGMCGRRCRYPETCCNGRCVHTWYDRKNCGGCHNRCKRGSFCYRGMCSYA